MDDEDVEQGVDVGLPCDSPFRMRRAVLIAALLSSLGVGAVACPANGEPLAQRETELARVWLPLVSRCVALANRSPKVSPGPAAICSTNPEDDFRHPSRVDGLTALIDDIRALCTQVLEVLPPGSPALEYAAVGRNKSGEFLSCDKGPLPPQGSPPGVFVRLKSHHSPPNCRHYTGSQQCHVDEHGVLTSVSSVSRHEGGGFIVLLEDAKLFVGTGITSGAASDPETSARRAGLATFTAFGGG